MLVTEMDDIRESLSRMPYEELLDEAVWTRSFLNNVAEQCRVEGCSSLVAYVDKLRHENAELRSLVLSLSENLKICCGGCWIERGNVRECENEACDHKKNYRRICALGIEADW